MGVLKQPRPGTAEPTGDAGKHSNLRSSNECNLVRPSFQSIPRIIATHWPVEAGAGGL